MATVDQGLITRIAQQEGVDPALFNRLIMAESGGRSDAVSSAGAIGPAQLMPATAKELGVDPNDVEQNLIGGARYFRQQMERFGEPKLALAAYNAGPANVDKYGGVPPFAETQNYIAKILGSQTMADVTQPTAAPTAAPYDPMSNLSKSQRMMLAFGALRDAGAALTGKEGRSFATTLAGINDQQDMARKAQAAARQQEFMQGLGGLTGSSVGVDTGTPDFQGQKQQVLQAAAADLIDGPTAKLYIDEINANAAKFTAKGLGPSVAAEGQAGRKPINEMSVAELDQYATEIAPLSANQDMKDFVTTTLGQIKTQRENKMGQEKSVGQASNMLSTIDSILSDEGLGDVVGTGGIWSKVLQGVGLGSLAPSAARALSKIQQIQGQTFLQAYEGLRGGGQITEIEGKKAEAALARLNTDQSPEDFKAALGELRIIVENGMKRARGENVEEYTGEETPSATGLPKVRVYDPTTGTFK
jgi:hypothetical protein